MRLDYLKIDSFKNLRDFEIDFDQGSQTTVLVGRNGSGKSNLLEALTIIFRDLDMGETPSFGYELRYICRDRKIKIIANPESSPREAMRVFIERKQEEAGQVSLFDNQTDSFEEITYSRFKQDAREKYLPRYVFGYYSGPSNRMEQHFERHQERFYQDLINGRERPLRPLLYARLVHSQFVLLAFFSENDPEIQRFLNEHLWIQGLDSVLFVMRQPPWKSKDGDPRFWYARGAVSDFLAQLYRDSLAPMRLKQRVQMDFRSRSTLEHLYLYLTDIDALQRLAGAYGNQQDFFKALESTYISKLISEVRIKVRIRNMDGSLTFRELSDGEQQLLMVLGLLRFTKEDESLFLLDEPDTHLNPAWSLQYLDFLRQVVGEQPNSHIIMTTHDPLTIAGLKREQVQIIQRDETSGKISAGYPEQDPRGMGIAALLTSDVYGLRSQLDVQTLADLDRKRELEVKASLSVKEKRELHDLTERLMKLDFSKTARDPLYEPFVKAMTQVLEEEGLNLPVLTPEQQERQRELSLEIVKRLRSKKEEKSDRVNAHAPVWQELKEALSKVSHHKCWYCESSEIRSDNTVDHFRPKNSVCECDDHSGYWWLAFDWHNYRLSCTYCNSHRKDKVNKTSGGKQDHFPLCDENLRAYKPGDDITREQPILLDPTTRSDIGLLWFEIDGRAVPKYDEPRYPLQFQRAKSSIELYHLNHQDIKDRRQELLNFLKRRIKEGNLFFTRYTNEDNTAYHAFESVLNDFASAVEEKAAYSSAARSILFGISKQDGYEWVESVL